MEHVVLVDELNNVLGIKNKASVHQQQTPLHRAFSVFIFEHNGFLLVQKRSENKKAWPLIWSNSCCGHPMLNESDPEGIIRRCQFELGIKVFNIIKISDYSYCFSYQGIMENEICPVYIASTDEKPIINKNEVASVLWLSWPQWLQEIENQPEHYSPWCIEETMLLKRSPLFNHRLCNYNPFPQVC